MAHFRLTWVPQKRRYLKRPIISFRPRLSQEKCMQSYLEFEIKLPTGDGYNCKGTFLRFFKIHLTHFRLNGR